MVLALAAHLQLASMGVILVIAADSALRRSLCRSRADSSTSLNVRAYARYEAAGKCAVTPSHAATSAASSCAEANE